MIRQAFILLAMTGVISAQADQIVFESKPVRTHLIELYTSKDAAVVRRPRPG